MDLQKVSGTEFMLSLSSRELELVFSCLRQSFAVVGGQEYFLWTGIPMDEALTITLELKAAMEREGLGL